VAGNSPPVIRGRCSRARTWAATGSPPTWSSCRTACTTGPVGIAEATAAISAYQSGKVTPERYRGRAGQPRPAQQEEHDLLTRAGSLAVAALA
jgi:hypothetical protein